ncbi:MAG: amino acid ABC transporter permease [Candidatus Hadarchaeum sp.]|uniref:amino acid ABC transporter permease n=1 Tax=Candidatus Hadarchaeum sp. TaxID=2883567 RepID=UPI00317FCD9F
MIQIGLYEMLSIFARGLQETVKLIPLCLLISIAGGVLLGIIRSYRVPIIDQILYLYIIFMRGIPPLIVLYIVFFLARLRSPFLAAIIGLSVYHIAYVSEIVRGGILAVPKGQFEAAKAVALTSVQTMVLVILPQIWYAIVPALAGQFIILIKDTALVSVIGARTILWAGQQIMNLTGKPFVPYLLVGFTYYILCSLTAASGRMIERRFERKGVR